MQFKINVTFLGLITFPAKYETAVEKPPTMKNLCLGQPGHNAHDPQPITQPKTCATCGPITDITLLKKGVPNGSSFAVVDATDVADAKEAYTKQYKKAISIVPHPSADVLAKTIPTGSTYYLVPEAAANEDHYRMIAQLIQTHPELAFCGLHTPRSATSLYQIVVRNDVLVMQQVAQTERLKAAPTVGGSINPQLFPMLEQMLTVGTVPFDPAAYENAYDAEVARLAAQAQEVIQIGAKKSEPATAPATTDDDLMAKLVASLGGQS